MHRYGIEVEIEPGSGADVTPVQVVRLVEAALRAERVRSGARVYLRVTTDEELAALNAAYRGAAGPTDVLSFPIQGDADWVRAPDEPFELGDIMISWPRIVAQAAEQGHPPTHELALMVVHGCLHLLGYDHHEDSDRQRMWARQEAILSALGIIAAVD